MSDKIGAAAIVVSLASLCCSVICLVSAGNAKNTAPAEPAEPSPAVSVMGDEADQFVMYVGTNDKDTYKLEITKEEAREIVDEVCLRLFPYGYTLQEATGAWTDEANNITHEYTLVCYFDGADIGTVHKAADELIEKLNQNSILIEHKLINIDYYSGSKE